MTDVHIAVDHEHSHTAGSEHHHQDKDANILVRLAETLHIPGFGHDHHHADARVFDNELGILTVRRALLILGLTTVLQVLIYMASGSVALLADTVHNLGDALNSIPLWVAYVLARRSPTRRFTYGLGRAEDVSGLIIVISIVFSAGYILWEAIARLLNPQPLTNLGWMAVAAIIGFAGNELVAVMQIRVGRKIGSEAMVADGLHARTDGLTSLAVLVAAGGAWLGFPLLDPIVGIVIGLAVIQIGWQATRLVWLRLLDGVDPALVAAVETIIQAHPEFKGIDRLQIRWLGHQLRCELVLVIDSELPVTAVHERVAHLRHHLQHELPNLGEVTTQLIPR
jgi:cation diffusion facilitator family transporter